MRYYYGKLSSVLVVAMALLLTACLSGGGGGDSGTSSSAAPGPVPGTCTSVTYAAPSGAANNIVFTFDKAYTCGQFANGDWWVSKDANPSVTITSITPTAAGGRNGFEVNPTTINTQAFDNTSSVPYDATLMPALPLSLTGVSSVLKTVAGTPTPPGNFSVLQFAAVLTIVDAPVVGSGNVFRPGYFGTAGKTFYPIPSAATVAALPGATHTPVGVPSLAGFSIASVATRYSGVQLDHHRGFRGRTTHPQDNMQDYGAEIATDNGVNLLRMLLSDFDYTNATHKQALINYLQMAIDLRSMAAGGQTWDADGGHGNGRKIPLLAANKVFGGTDFSTAIAASGFSEDQLVWRSPVTNEVLYGKSSGGEAGYWRTTRGELGELPAGGARDVRDFYGRIDGGGYEIGDVYQVCCNPKQWKYTVLALYLMGLETPPTSLPLPATDNLVEYVERWVNYGTKAADTTTSINLTTGVITSVPHGLPVCARPAVPPTTTASTALVTGQRYKIQTVGTTTWTTVGAADNNVGTEFTATGTAAGTGVASLVETYNLNYGPDGLGGCIVGTNNWATTIDNTSANGGGFGNTFGDELWAWFR